jgi:hypothetical protein
VSQHNVGTYSSPDDVFNGSDYLVIKSVNVAAQNAADQKWTYLSSTNTTRPWLSTAGTPTSENLQPNNTVIALSVINSGSRSLIVNGSAFSTTFTSSGLSSFVPTDANEVYPIYGIIDTAVANPRSPFNRADYFISASAPDGLPVPSRCAPKTGVLYKAVMNQTDGTFTYEPLLDCVANMQVFFGVDVDNNGSFQNGVGGDAYCQDLINGPCSTLSLSSFPFTAAQIRTQVKEVRVYVLTHEGRRDPNFTYPTTTINVGDTSIGNNYSYPLSTAAATDQRNYRWKVYQLVVKPLNLFSN